MKKPRYVPPEQGLFGMVIDSLLMLVLVFFALKAPAYMASLEAPAAVPEVTEAAAGPETPPTWAELGQNPTMQAAWEKLGKDPAAAKAIIDNRFDYTVDVPKLVLIVVLVAGYFFFMLRVSDQQYRDVIAEKFDQ
jgi:predicted PurR-regulated permease PerM